MARWSAIAGLLSHVQGRSHRTICDACSLVKIASPGVGGIAPEAVGRKWASAAGAVSVTGQTGRRARRPDFVVPGLCAVAAGLHIL